MSSSCVLMRRIFCGYFLFFIPVLLGLNEFAVAKPFIDKNEAHFSGDFMNFVKEMGKIFNKHNKESGSEVPNRPTVKQQGLISTTDRNKFISRRDVNKLITQKAALRDVLMMKLVSYYEDKYKLSNSKTTVMPKSYDYVTAKERRYEPLRDTLIEETHMVHRPVTDYHEEHNNNVDAGVVVI